MPALEYEPPGRNGFDEKGFFLFVSAPILRARKENVLFSSGLFSCVLLFWGAANIERKIPLFAFLAIPGFCCRLLAGRPY